MDAIRRYSVLIDGDWVDTDDRFEIRSPATEQIVASVAKCGVSAERCPTETAITRMEA